MKLAGLRQAFYFVGTLVGDTTFDTKIVVSPIVSPSTN